MLYEEVKKNKVLQDCAYIFFKNYSNKNTSYNKALDAVFKAIEIRVKNGIYFSKLWKFVRCDLDDENYTEAKYEFFDTLEEGKESCFKELPFDPMLGNGELEYKEVCTLDEKPNFFRLDQSQENCFHVMEVLPYEPKGEYACIWYHAYEGVGFEVLFVGTYDKCAEYAKSSAKKVCADFKDGEYTEYYDQVVVDTGMEWQIWDIVKLPE